MFGIFKKDKKTDNTVITAPISGEVVALEKVKDEAFSTGILGLGVAIQPDEGIVVAPADGQISTMFDTGHAVSLVTEDGAEILIHVGIDTVNLKGKYYNILKHTDDKVQKGEVLIEFDMEAIAQEGFDTITPVLVCNTDDFENISLGETAHVNRGDDLLYLKKKGDK